MSYPERSPRGPDGYIYIIYDYNRNSDREILMAKLREDDHHRRTARLGRLGAENRDKQSLWIKRKIKNTAGRPRFPFHWEAVVRRFIFTGVGHATLILALRE